jgi:DNA-binding response OmpR family regulator
MKPAKILLVDDEKIMLSLLEAFLNEYGCTTCKATDGHQAIRILETAQFDLVITDLQLATTSGLDVIRKAKELYPDMPVFMMTGCYEVQYAIEAFRNGVDDYLLKPFSMHILLERLRENGFANSSPSGGRPEFSRRRTICQDHLQGVDGSLYIFSGSQAKS